MKAELRSESQAEICWGRKIRGIPFFCPTYLSAILPLGREPWSPVKTSQKAVIAMDSGAKPMRKSENSHFSRILAFWPFFRWNPLQCNPFQLKQTGGFLGFPENFSGGGIWGGGGQEILILILILIGPRIL
jgi:hypothetical protein